MSEWTIEFENVNKSYGSTHAVRDVSFQVQRGELFAFLGPNGAGKTTTIKMIAGLLHADSGEVRVCGYPMGTDGMAARAQMAYVPDLPFLYDKLTGREFLHFTAEMYRIRRAQREARLAPLIERLQLEPFLDRLTESYSHGMKQRVVLAAALSHDPRLLMIDEPMVGLDPRTVRVVKDLFRERTERGGTVFMSTHTLEVAEALAHRIGILNKGRLIAVGTLDELRDRAAKHHSLEEIFLQLTDGSDDAESC